MRKWQEEWDEHPQNKLHTVQPLVTESIFSWPQERKDQVILTRCLIGHSRLTHVYLMEREDPPECIACQCPLTIKHVLLECIDFNHIRQRFYRADTLTAVFKTVKCELILSFLQAAGLYDKI